MWTDRDSSQLASLHKICESISNYARYVHFPPAKTNLKLLPV